MGFAPPVVRAMTFWEFHHATAAWSEANGGGAARSDASPDALAALDTLMARAPSKLH